MKFDQTLQEATFVRRYKRFFADVRIGSEMGVAHVPNTGSLKGCVESERPCLISVSDDPKRKLKYTLQMVYTPPTWVGVNTSLPAALVWELWQSRTVPHWQTFDCAQAEVKISDASRIDLVLWNSKDSFQASEKLTFQHCLQQQSPLHFIEIKSVTLAQDRQALFPDCVSVRAQKHVRELMILQEAGHTTEFVFVIQRDDCDVFRAAHEIDPAYAKLLASAHQQGVRITPLPCQITPAGIELKPQELPFIQK